MQVSFTLPLKLKTVQAEVIKTTLEIQKGNRTHTAKALGIGIRTLQRQLKKAGLSEYLKADEVVAPPSQTDSPAVESVA